MTLSLHFFCGKMQALHLSYKIIIEMNEILESRRVLKLWNVEGMIVSIDLYQFHWRPGGKFQVCG